MRRFKSILFVADGSEGQESVLGRAVELANTNDAKLTLFDAIEAEDYRFDDPQTVAAVEAVNKANFEARRDELESLCRAASAKYPGLQTAVEVEGGTAARGIVLSVLVNRHDLVMKAPGGKRRLFGSTDQKLMRKCPCPVWILKPAHESFQRILAAVDLNPMEQETESLAREIMSLATSLAAEEQSELHVVHAWRLSGETALRGRSIDTTDVDRIVQQMEAAHQHELDRLLESYEYGNRTVHLVKGNAGDVIPSLADKLDADLVIIGTVGRSGVPGLLIGNTAERVLNEVDCSVLTLKPEGFETPIQV